jgi:hypothetical protein
MLRFLHGVNTPQYVKKLHLIFTFSLSLISEVKVSLCSHHEVCFYVCYYAKYDYTRSKCFLTEIRYNEYYVPSVTVYIC